MIYWVWLAPFGSGHGLNCPHNRKVGGSNPPRNQIFNNLGHPASGALCSLSVFCQLSRCSLQGGGKNLIPENHWHRSAIRAFQAWPLLTFAARHHQLFTYQELGEHVGLPAQAVGPDSFHLVALYCEAKGLPLLNLIVVG